LERDYIVTKSNSLIASNYDLSVQEQKIILTLASMVQPEDENFKPYIFKIKDFMALVGVQDKAKYSELPKITKELMQKVFEIKQGNKITQLSWLSSAEYEKGTGLIELEFSPKLKPYMLELHGLHTSYKLENILSLKSKYSIRLYEILKSNLFKNQIEIEVEDLKKMVGANEKAYNVYTNFKSKVIFKAQKEIPLKTDISFDFEEIKTGRKVTSIKFFIKSNKKVNAPKEKEPINEVSVDREEKPLYIIEKDIQEIMAITKNEFGEETAMLFRTLSNGDISHIRKLYEYMNTRNVKDNRAGYMRTLLEKYEEPTQSTRRSKFNNFDPREKSERYSKLEELCLLGQASEEERKEFDEMRGAE